MIRQQRHGLDRLGTGRAAAPAAANGRAIPRRSPAPARAMRRDRALRHVACDRRDAIELRLADAVGENVDQPGDVRAPAASIRLRRRLLRQQRLGHGRGEAS